MTQPARALQIVLMVLLGQSLSADSIPPQRPIAVVSSSDGKTIFVANREGRSISIVDAAASALTGEIKVDGKLADMAIISDDWLLALDSDRSLLSIRVRDGDWKVVASTRVPQYPIRIVLNREKTECFVTSLWTRSVTKFAISPSDEAIRKVGELELPFEPYQLCLSKDEAYVVIASCFDASLAIVNNDTFSIEKIREFTGHNIGGLAIKNDGSILWTMQELSPIAHSTQDDIHWGNMISNGLVEVPLQMLLGEAPSVEDRLTKWQLGEPGLAAGDPGSILVTDDNNCAVALSGVGQIAIGSLRAPQSLKRVDVGKRPVSMTNVGKRLVVANMHSDSISLIEPGIEPKVTHVSLGNTTELSPAQKGEVLFFDSKLSLDGWMSCHSCHTLGHSNHRLNDNLSDGSFGAPKRVPSLHDVRESGPWAWNGKVATLEEQVTQSVENTMHGRKLTEDEVGSLVAYLKSLEVPRIESHIAGSNEIHIDSGKSLFEEFNCANCHAPPTYTTQRSYDVNLKDSMDNREFNPPSLKGLAFRNRLFHDSRASSLLDIFQTYKHGITRQLSESELSALVAFLRSR